MRKPAYSPCVIPPGAFAVAAPNSGTKGAIKTGNNTVNTSISARQPSTESARIRLGPTLTSSDVTPKLP